MPRIGMRIFKTFIAVYLCFIIYLLRGEIGSPFYSAIAAILCMQPYVKNSFNVALNRTVGTFIGGGMGLLYLLFERNFIPADLLLVQYLVLSFCVIPLIYLMVKINKPSAAYITCVVFMSITVTHGADVNPLIFTVDRIVDTLIGVFVSLGVNVFHLPRKKNRKILFVTNLDGSLLNSKGEISSYSKIKLNTMINQGALITIATTRSVETILPLMKEVEMKLPIIIMNGAVMYDLKNRKFSKCRKIDSITAKKIIAVFHELGLNCFAYTIINDVLHVYYSKLLNPVEEKIYHSKKRLPEQSYVCGELPGNQNVLSIIAVNKFDVIQEIKEQLLQSHLAELINIEIYPDEENEGYFYMEITSHDVSVKNAILEMKVDYEANQVVAFGNDVRNTAMLRISDYPYIVDNASEELKAFDFIPIGNNDSDAVVKMIARHFYSKLGLGH